ncbi:hypothetical protein I312_105729 [Cryptococcus bacillisporus CA1280]|uniref:Pre-rRNA-processing protein fhl1 n=1 Tax=Cryptococcus bacillisporus CA1280 TaxID=1296109 RepID=A0A0D0TDH9_CRYGA|nr:hypothetical protein I312_06400 [Cryptococcus bacillisporus CA1280]
MSHHPPAPSLAALPVDTSKTDPTPAYYKLQFGDDLTGFSYYVRTLTVVIGRNCERPAPVPPPAITNPSVPTNPPLDPNEPSPPSLYSGSILTTPPVANLNSPSVVEEDHEVNLEDYGPLVELAEAVAVKEEDVADSIPPVLELPDAPPPPPPPKSSANIEHVDVDLGPLKSVSRNHAKIEYRSDLGRFCLEILGRNGAWIDDRYYVKGAVVPLAQGAQIQIATRIFSFVLPPSSVSSPPYNYYDQSTLENVENLPYPYNLPASEVRYQEFFGEAGPGPATAAAMASRQPPAFNAFAAADGYGLGLGVDVEGQWGQWESEEESDSDAERDYEQSFERDGEGDAHDEDQAEDEDWDDAQSDEEDEYEEIKPKQATKIKLKKPLIVPGDDESDLSSLDSEPERPLKAFKKQAGKKQSQSQSKSAENEKSKAPKDAKKLSKKESKSKKKVKEPTPPVEEAPGEVKGTPSKSKKKEKEKEKNKADSGAEQKQDTPAVTSDEKEKATPQKKDQKKKIKPASESKPPAKPASGLKLPIPLAQQQQQQQQPAAQPQPPSVPTLAAALANTPTPPTTAPTPAPQPAVRPPQQPVRPAPGQPQQGAVRHPGVPGQPGQPMIRPGQPGVPMGVRPPMSGPGQIPVRPGQPHPHLKQPLPSTPGVRPPLPQTSVPRTTPSSAGTTPQPTQPFFCTELKETAGRPGHIIVNVPIPPSGAGPRPPPGPILGLDGKPFIGPPPLKPTSTFATIIHKALSCLPRGRGTLGEVCNWVAGEWEWFRLNVDSGWQNSIRHNLSLNKAFLKVPRIPEDDPESKGSVWIIDPQEGPLFEEKQRRDAMKSASKDKNAESRREKERIRAEERAKKQREAAIEAARNPHAHPSYVHHPHPTMARAMPPMATARAIARPPATVAHPHPQPSTTQPTPSQPTSANIKGVLQPKAKITVVMQPITPALRAKSVIANADSNGNPLPFVCDGTTLVLDQSTFGHLTSDILDKLTLLGAAGAVDVLSAWVINKNKMQASKAAQQAKTGATGTTTTSSAAPGVAGAKNGVVNGAVRPTNGVQPARPQTHVPPKPNTIPPVRPVVPPKPAATPTAPVATATTASANPTPSTTPAVKPASSNAPKSLPGPAPPGTSLTKVIGMIAAVANAKGDVNTVGPNASALLRYIRVVGVEIDLRVAERIWATGVVPPLPVKKVAKPANGTATGSAVAGSAKPAQGAGVKPQGQAQGGVKPVQSASVPASASNVTVAGMKRKLEDGAHGQGQAQGNSNGAASGTGVDQEAKKPRLETSSV